MICTSIQYRNLEAIFDALDEPGVEMAEIRLDLCPLTLEEIDELFSDSDFPLVATCRIGEGMPSAVAEARLMRAIEAGAAFVDVELEAPPMMSKRLRREARESGCRMIRSYHDFSGTDSTEAIKALVEKCLHLGADIVKLVTTASGQADINRVMSLYDTFEPGRLIAFCMGETGRESRVECLRKGAPFTYAALAPGEETAPGQWLTANLSAKVYGNLRMPGYHAMDRDPEGIRMPCSKSFAQRAIIAASLARGVSHLEGYSPCGDNESALAVARALGADVSCSGRTLTIRGIGATPGCFTGSELHTGESGFLTRLMIPTMALLGSGPVRLTGEKTLLTRPLAGAHAIMEAFGVTLESESDPVRVPLTVRGSLEPGLASISGKDGSQLISGLLTALPLCAESSTVHVTDPKSLPYLFMTADVLKRFGIRIESEMEGDEIFMETQDWDHCTELTFRIRGGQRLHAADLDLEGDWSAAANFLVAGAVFGQAELTGLDTDSLQADLSIMDILMEAGASMSQMDDNGAIHVQRAPLTAFDVDAANCPDLFPILAVLAAFCQGTSHISGASRLVHKESNRAQAILDMLNRMGVFARLKGDCLHVEGHSLAQRLLTGMLLKGGRYTSLHDHRMVMALMVASLGADAPVEIDDTACVAKSFPSFLELFETL